MPGWTGKDKEKISMIVKESGNYVSAFAFDA